MSITPGDPVQSHGEEIANSISHGLGALATLVGAPFLIVAASKTGSPWTILGASVFLGSMLLLYLSSTLYHALTFPTAKSVFRIFDHGAIFLLIAGTYTPFTLGVLRGPWGWTLFGIVWAFAILGIVLKAANALWHPVVSNTIYLGLSWLIVIAARPMWTHVSHFGIALIFLGGIFYSGGIYFYNTTRFRYAHMLWHICVLAGTACHYFAVLGTV